MKTPVPFQPQPKLCDKSFIEIGRAHVTGGEPCVTLLVEHGRKVDATEILITYRELRRLARWCNWERRKSERPTWPAS